MKYQKFLKAYKKETDSKLYTKQVKKCSQMTYDFKRSEKKIYNLFRSITAANISEIINEIYKICLSVCLSILNSVHDEYNPILLPYF